MARAVWSRHAGAPRDAEKLDGAASRVGWGTACHPAGRDVSRRCALGARGAREGHAYPESRSGAARMRRRGRNAEGEVRTLRVLNAREDGTRIGNCLARRLDIEDMGWALLRSSRRRDRPESGRFFLRRALLELDRFARRARRHYGHTDARRRRRSMLQRSASASAGRPRGSRHWLVERLQRIRVRDVVACYAATSGRAHSQGIAGRRASIRNI